MVYVLVAELATSWASLRFNESDEKTGTSFSQFFFTTKRNSRLKDIDYFIVGLVGSIGLIKALKLFVINIEQEFVIIPSSITTTLELIVMFTIMKISFPSFFTKI